MFDEIPDSYQMNQMNKEELLAATSKESIVLDLADYGYKEVMRIVPDMTISTDFAGEKAYNVGELAICLKNDQKSETGTTITIRNYEQDFTPIMKLLEGSDIKNFFNIVDIPADNYNIKVLSGDTYMSDSEFLVFRADRKLYFIRKGDFRYRVLSNSKVVKMVELNIDDILYYKSEGSVSYTQKVTGSGGAGVNYGGAAVGALLGLAVGGILFAGAAALIGSRAGEQNAQTISSELVEHDTRMVSMVIMVDGARYRIGK